MAPLGQTSGRGRDPGKPHRSPPSASVEGNYWRSVDGPAPTDSGDRISANVDADPFLTSLLPCPVTNFPPVADNLMVNTDEDVLVGIVLTASDDDGDSLTYSVLDGPDHGTLTGAAPNLTYTPHPDYNGPDSFTFTANDGTYDSNVATVSIIVKSVNDAPSFTAGAGQEVDEDAGTQTVAGWATSISPGPANESGQDVSFNVTNDNNALFSAQPAVASDGTLTYTPAPNAHGTATVTVAAVDDGGTANGGVDTSAEQTFVITVNSVIDALIDVKPGNGDEVDPINLGSNGKTPIAILATQSAAGEPDDFDPTLVDLSLITFKINGESLTPSKMTLKDVDGDGDLDLLLHFLTQNLVKRGQNYF